jgi:hypothetical protein
VRLPRAATWGARGDTALSLSPESRHLPVSLAEVSNGPDGGIVGFAVALSCRSPSCSRYHSHGLGRAAAE